MVSDQQLIQLAEVFVRAFQAALVESDEVFRTLLKEPGKGFSIGAHGTVEFTRNCWTLHEICQPELSRFSAPIAFIKSQLKRLHVVLPLAPETLTP